ncbi:hypothetical protein H257_00583 [Aphanomyces astaci]|uniref:Uncharacterized protein n=1 Tax=Aphanomyces astaci TaxID=112090 RepID=W4HBB5_APHAT|nr:hypothetical protein H257_00583 [Aphanomyces astaci]ETV89227.1 hypothetical protein H257_00583 [Aphanomyces astaci]|eukprot:XP_009821627.1 hypothetical protein H257_00583 [Aphanomyces astaci]
MVISSASSKSTSDLGLLVFDGKKSSFRVWSQSFVSYLEGMTLEMVGNYLKEPKSLPEPQIKYEDWLHCEPPIISTGNEAHDRWHLYNRKRTEQKPFDNIQSWFGEMKSLKNLINAQSRQHLGRDTNQGKRHDTGKAFSKATSKSRKCFYCEGKYNVNGVDHMKWDCPKRQDDFRRGWARSSIFEDPRRIEDAVPKGRDVRTEVACGAVVRREEVALSTSPPSRQEFDLPGMSMDDMFSCPDDSNLLSYSPALAVDTTSTPRVETMAASMPDLSVKKDQS